VADLSRLGHRKEQSDDITPSGMQRRTGYQNWAALVKAYIALPVAFVDTEHFCKHGSFEIYIFIRFLHMDF